MCSRSCARAATGLPYSDEKAHKILGDILGGRDPVEDDTFACADFYSMFFTLRTWAEGPDHMEVLLSHSLEVRYQAFIKKRADSASQPVPALLSGHATAPKFPHLSFPGPIPLRLSWCADMGGARSVATEARRPTGQ